MRALKLQDAKDPQGHTCDAMGTPVVAARDGPKPLLPCRVPDLQLDRLALQLHRLDLHARSSRSAASRTSEERRPPTPALKSTPMVELKLSVYVSSEKRRSRHDFPTPESPIRISLNK